MDYVKVKKLFLFLIVLLLLLPCGAGGGEIDIRYPVGEYSDDWFADGCGTDYLCVDDVAGSHDNWNTYLYRSGFDNEATFDFNSLTLTSVDSVRMLVDGCDFGDYSLNVGWEYYNGASWVWYTERSIGLPGDFLGDSIVTALDDEEGNPWTPSHVDSCRFGISRNGIGDQYVTAYRLEVYGEAGTAAAQVRKIRRLKEAVKP